MRRRTLDEFIRDNLFISLMLPSAAFVVLFLRLVFSAAEGGGSSASAVPLGGATGGFDLSCFDGRMRIVCDPRGEKKEFCTRDLRRTLNRICARMELMGVAPLGNIDIRLKRFETKTVEVKESGRKRLITTCDKEIKRDADCMPHFQPEEGWLDRGYIVLPDETLDDKSGGTVVLAHELVHAAMSAYSRRATRVVKEFFAIYVQNRFASYRYFDVCNGKEWNQRALRTFGGDYVFPPNDELSVILSDCRYGQLEYLTRRLEKYAPDLFGALWRRLQNHKTGMVNVPLLKKWIKEFDYGAWAEISDAHILQESDRRSSLAMIRHNNRYCSFVYRAANGWREEYVRAGFQIDWFREKKFMGSGGKIFVPHFCVDAGRFSADDILEARAFDGDRTLSLRHRVPLY